MAPKPKRRIKSAKITLISLVPRGANMVASIFKGENVVEMQAVAKLGPEGYLTALVYVPDTIDSQGDTASAQAIKQMAHDFVSNMDSNGIDVMHDCSPTGAERARICETFIVQKGDPRFEDITDTDGKPIDATGAWGVVIKIDDPELRKLYASGEWVGVSMFGSATVEPVTKSTISTKEQQMDEKQMAELFKTLGADLAKQVVEGIVAAQKAAQPAPAAAPEPVAFEGDPFSPEDVQKHQDKVLFNSLDLAKAADVQKWADHVAKRKAAEKPAANADEIAKLEKEIKRLRGAPVDGGEPVRKGPESLADKLAKASARATELRKQGVIR